MARARWLTPDEIPSATKCRTLTIPDNLDLIMAVSGALLDLTYSYNWEQFGAVTPEEAAEAMFAMYRAFVASLNDCEVVPVAIVGEIRMMANATLPDGWLYCNGDEVAKETYPALWDAIATFWGTPTNPDLFKLPDLRNRFPLGFMQGGGAPVFASTGGEATVSLTAAQNGAHSHAALDTTTGASPNTMTWAATPGNGTPTLYGTHPSGSGSPHNNMPPYAAISFIIYAGG